MAYESQPAMSQSPKCRDVPPFLHSAAVIYPNVGDVLPRRAHIVETAGTRLPLSSSIKSGAISDMIAASPATRRPIISRMLETKCSLR